MKFDIVRAWKDEAYRQTLSTEELNTLPANPVGEISDADLEAAFGGWGPGWAPYGPACTSVESHASSTALICEVNLFTVNANVLAVPIQLLSGPNSNCVGMH